jgi:hypothetical protein
MVTLFDVQRLCAIAVAVVIFCGCRSASVNSSAGVTRPFANGWPSYSRPYGSARPYQRNMPSDDSQNGSDSVPVYESPTPDSDLSAPRPSDTPLPPSPEAKKSRWNLKAPSSKLSSTTRNNSQVNHTGSKSERESLKVAKGGRTAQQDEFAGQAPEEIVIPRTPPAAPRFSTRDVMSRRTPSLDLIPRPLPTEDTNHGDASTNDMPLLLPPAN